MPDTAPTNSIYHEPSKIVPILFVVINVGLLYVVYMMYHCLPLLANKASYDEAVTEVVFFNILTLLIVVCFLRALFTSPGYIPSAEDGDSTWEYKDPTTRGNSIMSSLGLGLQEVKRTGERRHCKWCRKYKPDRAHHCRTCRRCVLKMDHHCPWINNCVGFANHKYFFLLLLYSSIATNLIIWTMLESVQTSIDTTVPFSTMFLLIFGETLASFLGLVVTVFFLFHVWLMLKAMTTIEFCEKSMKRNWDTSVYNRGFYGNLCAVLGDNPVLWFLPVSPPSGNGLNFNMEDSRLLKDMEAGSSGMHKMKSKSKKKRGMAGTGEYAASDFSAGTDRTLLSSTLSNTEKEEYVRAEFGGASGLIGGPPSY